MGLFDIFNAEARKQKSFDKMRAKLVSKNMQHDDRMWCIQQLAEMDNEEATRALFRRWDMVSDKKREDLAEKEYLADVLVQKGDSMLASLREHNDRSVNITWPIQVLRRIATDEEVVDELVRVLALLHGFAARTCRGTHTCSVLQKCHKKQHRPQKDTSQCSAM